jgi:glycosyltransferase involved in cell wall biosynthesis
VDVAFVNRMLGMTRGGGEIWDLKMAEQLEEMGVDVTFYVGKPLFSGLADPIEAFDSIAIPTPHLRDMAYAAPIGIGGALYDIDEWVFRRRVVDRLLDANHDIIHVNSDPQFGRFVDRFDSPVVVKMNGPPHSLWQDYLNPFSSSYDFFEKFDAVIATGVTTEEIEKRTDVDVHTINPGVDTDQFTPNYEETDSNTVLFVGRFVPAKNLTTLVQAFSEVQMNHPNTELVLVGDGPGRNRIESEIEALGLKDSVSLPGYVDNESMPRYYHNASVFALASKRESFGIVLLEAMSCGIPVVAPEVGWIPHIVDDEWNGLLWDTEEDLVAHLDYLLSNPEIRRQYGEYGRKKAIDGFDWKKRAKDLISVYDNTL